MLISAGKILGYGAKTPEIRNKMKITHLILIVAESSTTLRTPVHKKVPILNMKHPRVQLCLYVSNYSQCQSKTTDVLQSVIKLYEPTADVYFSFTEYNSLTQNLWKV